MTDQAPIPFDNEPTLDAPSAKVAAILDQYLEDIQNGRACSREELLKKHPGIEDLLSEYLSSIEMVAGLAGEDELLSKSLGDFEIVSAIGAGAMGVVYRANQASLKRQVALKVLRYTVVGEQATKRFEREAELVATLRHPHIVPIYTTGKEEGSHYLAMRLIDGPSLSEWSAEEDVQRDPKAIAKWGAQVASALDHAHQKDVIHRDVKPSNLLLEDDHVWLSDFGLARRFDDLRMSMTGAMLGTPNYMSPEQAAPARHPVDRRSDIYSLGATLFELLTGRCVFVADTPHAVLAQVIAEEPPRLREVLPDASRDLETILLKCLEKDPSDRYQNAQQLAEDLEAFAEDRSIKARRPSLVERFSRWKRSNRKAVSWALSAASAAVVMLCVLVAGWISWNNSQFGELNIQSEEGPIVGRLIDAKGNPTPVFTIPTEHPMPVKQGDYTLQTWASGKMGVNQHFSIDRSEVTDVDLQMFDDTVFPERTVQGVPAVLPLGDRDDLIFFNNQGLTRVDGRTGKERWTAQADDFVKAVNSDSKGKLKRTFGWRFDGLHSYDQKSQLPSVTHGFPDINADGQPDVLIANHSHPSLLSFDGKSGELLWHYVATPTKTSSKEKRPYSGAIHSPRPIGDIDGDGVLDFAIYFCSGKNVQQWLDAISGKTGKRIWRKQLPAKLVAQASYNLSTFCQMNAIFGPSNWDGGYRGTYYQPGYPRTVVAWPPMAMAGPKGSDEFLLLVCGSKLMVCHAKTGEATDFNQGEPLELGFAPAVEPKLIPAALGQSALGQAALGQEKPIGVLLCEIVSIPDSNKRTKPVTRFSMRSLETGEEQWRFDAACDLNWTGTKPDWPLVADLSGDAVPEILIADGADLENDIHSGATRQGSLQVLNARTGEPLWDKRDVAKIRCRDRQVQHLLTGPDADGDFIDDVYVVSTMVARDFGLTGTSIYVDILSAASGKRIRTTKSEVPVFDHRLPGFELERPFFLGSGSDGHPRLVVATRRSFSTRSTRHSTVLLSTGTGEVTNVGDGLEYPLQADGDGDGQQDLFLIKPSNRRRINGAGQLLSIKSNGGREQTLAKGQYLPIDDVDRDGVRDLLNMKTWQTISGATGRQLRQWSLRPQEYRRITMLDDDIDGDEVKDFLMTEGSYTMDKRPRFVGLVSGQTGELLWKKRFHSPERHSFRNLSARCEDMNGDGVKDVVWLVGSDTTMDLFDVRVECLDGRSGTNHWSSGSLGLMPKFFLYSEGPLRIADINNDGSPDVLCPCFDVSRAEEAEGMVALNGRSGKLLWEQPAILSAGHYSHPHGVLGRSEIMSIGPSKQLVTTTPGDGASVRIRFSDLRNGMHVSTLVTRGQLVDGRGFSTGPLGLRHGIPFAVSAGEACYAGVCVRDKSTKNLELVVFKMGDAEATVVYRIKLPPLRRQVSKQTDPFLIADANGDGRTDVIFHDGADLVAIDLVSNIEFRRTPLPARSPRLSVVESDPSLFQLTTSEGRGRRDGEYNQLKLIDLKTFDVLWNIQSPPGAFVDSLLSAGKPDASNLHSSLPRILYEGTSGGTVGHQRVVASENDYMGDNPEVRQRISQAASMPVDFSLANFNDPRMLESLPWAEGNKLSRKELHGLVQDVFNMLMIVIGAAVFPFFFLRKMFSQKSWDLKTFLLLPLLFAIPYLVLQLPLEVKIDGYDDLRRDGIEWTAKLPGACFVLLPVLGFVTVWAKELWQRNWMRWGLLSITPIVIALLIAAMLLFSKSGSLPPGSRYDWYDFRSAKLVFSGVYFVGLVFVAAWFFSFLWGVMKGLRNMIFRRPKLAAE